MNNSVNDMRRRVTLRDELEFAMHAKITVEDMQEIDASDYAQCGEYDIHGLRRVLAFGNWAFNQEAWHNDDLTLPINARAICHEDVQAHPEYYETALHVERLCRASDESLLRRYFHSCLAGENLVQGYFVVPDIDRAESAGRKLWSEHAARAYALGRLPICEKHATRAHVMAFGAYRQMLWRSGDGNMSEEKRRRFWTAKVVCRSERFDVSIGFKVCVDHVGLDSFGEGILVGDYKPVDSVSDSAVRRRASESRWPMKAFACDLMTSARYGQPTRSVYFLSAIREDNHRVCDVSSDDLEEGRFMFARAVFRTRYQQGPRNEYDYE